MNFSDFIGIKCGDVDIETNEKLEHDAIYHRAIERLGGLDVIIPHIPFTLAEIKKALPQDENLNNLPLNKWDFAAGFMYSGIKLIREHSGVWSLFSRFGITSASPSQIVCLLKEAAREWAERGKS